MSRRPPKLPHDVSPFLQAIREFLLGRVHNSYLRFPERIAARTQPPPEIPDGCNHKLADNYYCDRDGRRLMKPNELIFESTGSRKAIAAASAKKEEGTVTVTEKKPRTPGSYYQPPLHERSSL